MKKWLCLLLALCMLLTCAGLCDGDILTDETTPVTVPDSADEDQPTGADTQIDGSASGADPQEGESQAGSGEGADSGETPEGSSDSGQTDEPGGSGEPTDPSDPAVPVEPADPDAPVDPADPDAPATPEGPETPEDPADPENPDEPEDPENPVQPDQPVDGEIDWDEVRSGEVWHETSDGEIIFGKLEDVLTALLTGGEPLDEENPLLIYICRDEVLRVREIRRGDVYYFAFAIDEVALPEAKDRQIVISETDPDAPAPDSGADDDQTEPDPEQIISLYVYLEQEQDPQPDDPEPEEPVLSVIASDYVADAWSNTVPVFALSGIPEDKAYWEYGVVRYGSTHVDIIEDGAFSALEEGEYTLRFVMLDELGNVVSASDLYTVKLDYTEPEIVAVNTDTGVSYQMVINAWDELSGAAQFSIDGGETWLDPEEGSMVYTALSKTTIEGGQIMVRDVAGNTAVWPDEVELKRASSGGYYGGGGGGGGGSRGIVHTKSSGFSKREYDTVNVSSEGGDAVTYMHTLTLDGQPMDLTLDLDRALGFAYDETYEPVFAMSLLYWADEPVSEDDGEDESADAKTPDPNTR